MATLSEIVGDSPAIVALRERVRHLLARVGSIRRPPPVLILGETGTGKGLLARALQGAGARATAPFLEINCAAIPENLLEAEMFGFERGAFTDARQPKPGLFQTAHGGTLFLDEVGLLPEALQGKLLKAIEDRVVRRLGGTRGEPADAWVLSATSVNLEAAVRERRFREDLYHRLAVFVLAVPPLRERGDDVALLAEHCLGRTCADYGLPLKRLTDGARAALRAYHWPGNVRELANAIERAALLSDGGRVEADHLGLPAARADDTAASTPGTGLELLGDAVGRVEREHLHAALERTRWNITRAAADLGISRDTLRYRIDKHGLRPGSAKRAPRTGAPPPRRPAAPPAAATGQPAGIDEPVEARPATLPGRAIRWVRRRVALLRVALDEPASGGPEPPAGDLDLLADKVASFGGRIEELGPGGFLAAFGVEPVEDAVQRAAHAALAIRNALDHLGAERRGAVRSRMAIHASRLAVGHGEPAWRIDLGAKRDAWQVADDLAASAGPGTIRVSEAAVSSLLRLFEVTPTTPVAAVPGTVYELAGHGRPAARSDHHLAPFVGREREVELLVGALAATVEGRGQSIGLVGEAGVGKSRLIAEFRRRLDSRDVEWFQGRCSSHGTGAPNVPPLLRQAFGLGHGDDARAVESKLRRSLEEIGLDAAALVPPILYLLGGGEPAAELAALSPEALRGRLFEALLAVCLGRSRARPLVLVVDDVQWIDRTSEAWLALLADNLPRARVLLVCTYRPGYRPPWMARSDATQIALRPLARPESLSVVRSILPAHAAAPVIERIVDRAEGNPFFLEELALSVEGRPGTTADSVPETVQEVLQARIDRLGEEPRALLDIAAVLGRSAPGVLLRTLWARPDPPEPHLRELAALEFLHEEGHGERMVHVFRHTLLRDATYQALVPARRCALHAAAAAVLEALDPDRLDELADRLAYHYGQAEMPVKAAEHLAKVAERAARIHAHAEALDALRAALAHVERSPEDDRDRRALVLVLRQADSLYLTGRLSDLMDLLDRYRARLDRLDDPSLAGPYHAWLAYMWSLLGNPARTVEHGRRAIEQARRCEDVGTIGRGLYVLAYECFWSGRPREGVAQARQAVSHLERVGDTWWLGQACWILAINHMMMGEFEAALDATSRTRLIGESLGDPRLRGTAAFTSGGCRALMGDWAAGIEGCRQAVDLATLASDPVNASVATGFLGGAYLESGEIAQAIPLLDRAADLCRRAGVLQTEGWFTALLAEARLLDGQGELARTLASRALDITMGLGYRYGIGWAQRALGRVDLAAREFSGAARWLGEALETFAAIEARYEVARTRLVLARVAHEQGDAAAVVAHVRGARSTFEALRLPRYVDLADRLAAELGLEVTADGGA